MNNYMFGKGIFGIDVEKLTRIEKLPSLDFSVCLFFGDNTPYVVIPCQTSKKMEECYKMCNQRFRNKFENVVDFEKYRRKKND